MQHELRKNAPFFSNFQPATQPCPCYQPPQPPHPQNTPQRQRHALHRLLLRRGEGEGAVGPLLRHKLPLPSLPGPESAAAAAAVAVTAAKLCKCSNVPSRRSHPAIRQPTSDNAHACQPASQPGGPTGNSNSTARRTHLKPFATHSMPCPTSFLPVSSSGCGPRNMSNTAPAAGAAKCGGWVFRGAGKPAQAGRQGERERTAAQQWLSAMAGSVFDGWLLGGMLRGRRAQGTAGTRRRCLARTCQQLAAGHTQLACPLVLQPPGGDGCSSRRRGSGGGPGWLNAARKFRSVTRGSRAAGIKIRSRHPQLATSNEPSLAHPPLPAPPPAWCSAQSGSPL
jgi:hypothetical protein